jgi:excisionase family DNA binding protein
MKHLKSTPSSNKNVTQTPLFENQIEENLITKKTLSEKLDLSVSYINKLLNKGYISGIGIGRSIRFQYSEVVAQLKRRSCK